jgi:23S rRNA pseudouridine1911/1915/1917 synthase
MSLIVVYSDNHLLLVDKPGGIPTQPTHASEKNLQDLAKEWIKKRYAKPGDVFLEPVHRLDKAASGLVLFARTSKALTRLNLAMRERKICKTYHAKTQGIPTLSDATLEHFLFHDNFCARIVQADHPGAKKARLHYRLLDAKEGIARLEVHLETGRYHQIRAQLSAIGCPILGDAKYGSTLFFRQNAIALCHVQMAFEHPVTKETLNFRLNSVI